MRPVYFVIGYFVFVNLALFIAMGTDKARARRRSRRISETTLFFLAIIGGSIGGILGMFTFRHKTKHLSFLAGFPVILALQTALCIFIVTR